jgi:hypothetical protein
VRKESQSNEPSGWAYRKKPISHFPTCILGAPSIGQLEKVDIGFDGSLPSEQLFGRSSSSTTNTPKIHADTFTRKKNHASDSHSDCTFPGHSGSPPTHFTPAKSQLVIDLAQRLVAASVSNWFNLS